jgi:hypothetical protein
MSSYPNKVEDAESGPLTYISNLPSLPKFPSSEPPTVSVSEKSEHHLPYNEFLIPKKPPPGSKATPGMPKPNMKRGQHKKRISHLKAFLLWFNTYRYVLHNNLMHVHGLKAFQKILHHRRDTKCHRSPLSHPGYLALSTRPYGSINPWKPPCWNPCEERTVPTRVISFREHIFCKGKSLYSLWQIPGPP